MSVARPLSAPDLARDLDGLRVRLAASDEAGELLPLGLGGVLLGAGVLDRIAEVVVELRRSDGDVVMHRRHASDGRARGRGQGDACSSRSRAGGCRSGASTSATRVRTRTPTRRRSTRPAASCAGAGVLVSVGSGTVVDIGKALSARLGGIPHVIVQTAGERQRVRRRPVGAARRRRQAHDGDALGRSARDRHGRDRAGSDRDEPRGTRRPARDVHGSGGLGCSRASSARTTATRRPSSRSPAATSTRSSISPRAISAGDPDAIDNLTAALTLSGISMGVAGRTAPASGMEHTVSHLIEMSERPGEPAALHGAKVGALSRAGGDAVGTGARRRSRRSPAVACASPIPPRCARACSPRLPRSTRRGGWARSAGAGTARSSSAGMRSRDRLAGLADRWEEFDLELDGLLATPQRLIDALRAAGAPLRLGQLGVDASDARAGRSGNCHLMRDRFSIADLAFFLGIWEQGDVDALLADAAAARGRSVRPAEAVRRLRARSRRNRLSRRRIAPGRPRHGAPDPRRRLADRVRDEQAARDRRAVRGEADRARHSGRTVRRRHRGRRARPLSARAPSRRRDAADRRGGRRRATRRRGVRRDARAGAGRRRRRLVRPHVRLREAIRRLSGCARTTVPRSSPPTPTRTARRPTVACPTARRCSRRSKRAPVRAPRRSSASRATTWRARSSIASGSIPSRAAVVGDRLMTDVMMARTVGAAGILVLSGATTADVVEGAEIKPDYVLAGIHELLPPTYAGVPS